MVGMKNVLQPLPKETAKAFAAFKVYAELGPERSIAKTGERLGKNRVTLEEWSAKNDWIERAKAYDAGQAALEQAALAKAAAKRGVDWARRAQELRGAEGEMAKRLLEGGRVLLERLLARQERKLTGSDVARLLEVASKLGRLSAGMATEQTTITGPENGPVRVELSAALTKVYGSNKNGSEGLMRAISGPSCEGADPPEALPGPKGVKNTAPEAAGALPAPRAGGPLAGGEEREGLDSQQAQPSTRPEASLTGESRPPVSAAEGRAG